MNKAFTIKRADRAACPDFKIGETVYKAAFHDYGCAGDDTRRTGIEHISVTRNPDGDYPFFTIPLVDLDAWPQKERERVCYYCNKSTTAPCGSCAEAESCTFPAQQAAKQGTKLSDAALAAAPSASAQQERHATKENGDCPHWCRACHREQQERDAAQEPQGEAQQRPTVAARAVREQFRHFYEVMGAPDSKDALSLFAQQESRKPLTDERVREVLDGIDFKRMVTADDIFYLIFRAAEREHGIGTGASKEVNE
jgi:hypothetical protein